MFTEINDKYYLNDMAMTILMADMVRDHIKEQDIIIMCPNLAKKTSEKLVESSKKNWRRPRDGSNKDLQDMYRSVPEAIVWAAQRETDERIYDQFMDRVDSLIDIIINPDNEEEF